MRSGLRGSLYLLLVGVLQCHCVMLWTVSTFVMKAFIAASCHCVVFFQFFRHCWVVFDPRVSLSSRLFHCEVFVCLVIVTRYFPPRVLMTFSLVIVTCFAMSCTAVRFSLALHAGVPTLLNFADQSFCWMKPPLDAEFRLLSPLCLLLCTIFLLSATSSEGLLFSPCGAPSSL